MLEFSLLVVISSELLSAGLALAIVYRMVRLFPIGFSFLSVSYLLLGVARTFDSLRVLAGPTSWLTASYGFAFLAATYFLSRRGSNSRLAPWLFSSLLILALIAIRIIIIPQFLVFASISIVHEEFRVFNLIMLGYVIWSLNRIFAHEPHSIGSVVLTGFWLLTIGQLSGLPWALDRGMWAYAFLHIFRIAGLLALLMIPTIESRKGEKN